MAYDGSEWVPAQPQPELKPHEKLRLLADFIEKLPSARLSMYCWGIKDEDEFTGCALGWGGYALAKELGYEYRPGGSGGSGRFLFQGKVTVQVFDMASDIFALKRGEPLYVFGCYDDSSGSCDGGSVVARLREAARRVERRSRSLPQKITRFFEKAFA